MKRTAIPIWLALGWIAAGCATPGAARMSHTDARSERLLAPKGPGAVFESIDEAAVDGLLTAYLQGAGERGARRRTRGGIVHPVEGGFSYGPIAVASSEVPGRLELRMGATDVARFHTSERSAHVKHRLNRPHSESDRFRVDRDPDRRPSYVLAARLRVWRYDGDNRESLVARLPSRWDPLRIASGSR